ncbi:MAG: signal peptidase I [Solirubrobacteraceae bacterium]
MAPSVPGQPERPKGPKRVLPKGAAGSIAELLLVVAVAIGLALGIQAFIVKPYRIPSESMEPTLRVGQHILADRIGMTISGPHVGEIVVFHPPKGADQENAESEGETICATTGRAVNPGHGPACSKPVAHEASVNFIKRIVAGPSDEIYISEGHVYRKTAATSKFVREHDPYINPCESKDPECNFPIPIKIPAGHWFMMGDNRGNSLDSRFWGPVPTSWIIGQAFLSYWPPDRIGTL